MLSVIARMKRPKVGEDEAISFDDGIASSSRFDIGTPRNDGYTASDKLENVKSLTLIGGNK